MPDGYRHMNGYGSHTFKWVNKEGKAHWVKFHFKTDQVRNLDTSTILLLFAVPLEGRFGHFIFPMFAGEIEALRGSHELRK